MAFSFEQWIGEHGLLGQSGFYNVVLPFLLLFVLLYGILGNIKLFGTDPKGKKISAIISLILALFITYSTSYLAWFAGFVSGSMGFVAVVLMAILFFFIIAGMILGKNPLEFLGIKDDKGKLKYGLAVWIILIAVVLLVIFGILRGGGAWPFSSGSLGINWGATGPTIITAVIVLGLIGLVLWAVFGKESPTH